MLNKLELICSNISWLLKNGRRRCLPFLLSLPVLCQPAGAVTDEVGKFLQQVEKEARQTGDPVVDRLISYRSQVEKEAYTTTLRLCEGYRRALGYGPVPFHGRFMYSEVDAAGVWLKIFNEGLMQPFSAIGGLKADFLDVNNYGFFDYYSWARSLYSLYFINSIGFLAGAMHCLDLSNEMNYFDRSAIETFADAIIYVDLQGTGLTEAAMLLSAGEIFNLIGKGVRFTFRPARYLMELLHLRFSRKHLLLGGMFVVPILADNFILRMQRLEAEREVILQLIENGAEIRAAKDRQARLFVLGQTYLLLDEAMKAERQMRKSDPTCPACADLYGKLRTFVSAAVSPEMLEGLKRDHSHLLRFSVVRGAATQSLGEEDRLYKDLLETLVPVIEEILKAQEKN